MGGGRLPADVLLTVIENTPLVSIDLLVVDEAGRLLVGKRVNEPARGTFFVPGGRIAKGEGHADALRRIAENEIGMKGLAWSDDNVVGVFTHIYDTNALDEPGVSTHYTVIGYRVDAPRELDPSGGDDQHSEFRWLERRDVDDETVHENTRAYLAYVDN